MNSTTNTQSDDEADCLCCEEEGEEMWDWEDDEIISNIIIHFTIKCNDGMVNYEGSPIQSYHFPLTLRYS